MIPTKPRKDMHRTLTNIPLAYFLTLRTYGTWLHGDDRGTVDKNHNKYQTQRLSAAPSKLMVSEARMKDEAYLLAADSAALVEQTIREVCAHRGWNPYAVHARTNHVHIVVAAAVSPERAMNDFKTWTTRRLRERGFAGSEQTVWTSHGSTPYLWTKPQLHAAIEYVKNWQGGPLQRTWDDVQRELDQEGGDLWQ